MTTYNTLKKIIPSDQALANQALSRSLRQVKDIFNTNLPDLANVISVLESNKDLTLINDLDSPVPQSVQDFWGNTFATGTGPGNTLTTNDLIGTASGNTHNTELPVVTSVLTQLNSLGALNTLTGNGGLPTSLTNGVYTVMSYCLGNAYTSVNVGPPEDYTITIPAGLPGAGTYGPYGSMTEAFSAAFGNGLIPAANSAIANIATTYSSLAAISNQATANMAQQLIINVENLSYAGIDIGNVVNDINNANLVANSVSTVLGLTGQLHEIGRDVTEGGAAQFFEAVANTSVLSGQSVIASMREGRNIAALNAVGIQLDTQLVDTNPTPKIANNLSDAQYTVAEARANVVI